MGSEYDEIGIWSEVKLDIIKEYAAAYTTIMRGQQRDRIPSLHWIYVDARMPDLVTTYLRQAAN